MPTIDEFPEITGEPSDHDGADWTPYRDPLGTPFTEVVSRTEYQTGDASGPYITSCINMVLVARRHNKGYNQDTECKCGHPYYRHFDTYENMSPVGCKYCECFVFEPRGVS